MKQLICIFSLLFLLISCSVGSYTVATEINDEIDPKIRSDINEISKSVLIAIKDQNYESLKDYLSPNLLALDKFDIQSFTDQFTVFLTNNQFAIKDQYYSRILEGKDDSIVTVIGSSDEDKFIINNLQFYDNESYNIFFTSTNPGPQYLFFMSLSKYSNNWKVNILQLGNYSLIGETAPILYKRSKSLFEEGHITSSGLLNIALNNIMRPAPFLQYKNEGEYKDFIQATSDKINEIYSFPIKLDKIEIIGLDIHFVSDDGIMPVILYLTNTEFNEELLKREIQENKEKLLEIFPYIDKDFSYAYMRAYNEMPTDKNKSYNIYTTALEFK